MRTRTLVLHVFPFFLFFVFFLSIIKRVKSRLYAVQNQSYCLPKNLACHLMASDGKSRKVITWEKKVNISKSKHLPYAISRFETLSTRWRGNIDRIVIIITHIRSQINRWKLPISNLSSTHNVFTNLFLILLALFKCFLL